MKKYFIFILLTFFFIQIQAQWQQCEGLEGGNIQQMISLDTALIALVEGAGIYRKIADADWELIYEEENLSLYQIVRAGNCLIVRGGWNESFCIRSFDAGSSWEDVPALNGNRKIQCINNIVFVPLYNGIGRSGDFGNTLDTLPLPLPMHPINIFSVDSLLYLHLSDGADEFGLLCSSDFGYSWNSISMNGLFDNQPTFIIEQMENINGDLWMQTDAHSVPYSIKQIFIFNEDSQKWVLINNNLPLYYGHHDLFEYNGKILCSIEYYPLYEFNYSDSSWTQFADGSKNVNHFLLFNDELYCATKQGACSLDTSGVWMTFNDGMNHRTITSMDQYDNKIYLTASNEVFYSEDGGLSFSPVENIWGKQIITTDSVFYIISDKEFKMSWDEGLSWQTFSDNLNAFFYQKLNHMDISQNCYYLATHQALYRTSCDSIHWQIPVNGPTPMDFNVSQVMSIDSTVIANNNTWASGYYFSYDDGATFNRSDDYIGGYLQRNDQTFFLFEYYNQTYFSEDAGYSWSSIQNPPYNMRNMDQIGDTLIYGSDRLVGISYDMGESWIDIVDNLPNISIYYWYNYYHVESFNQRIFAGCPINGLWYRDDLITGKKETVMNNPITVSVYPNPATKSCTLDIKLQEPSAVFINLYDQTGRVLKCLPIKTATDEHKVQLTLDQLQPAIYFYRCTSSSGSASGKIILSK